MARLNDNFTLRAPVPIDDKQGYWDGASWQPFASRQDAIDKTPFYRYRTLTLPVMENGDVVEYWFKNGIQDADLVLKTSQSDLSNYYTKTELQTAGQAAVHWDNLTNVPTLATDWGSIAGDQSVVEVGGFSNTIGYITSAVLSNYIPISQKGNPNGVATLDAGAKVPLNQLPDSILGQLRFGGTYDGNTIDATTSFPELNGQPLPNAADYEGVFFVSTAAYTEGGISYLVGDWIIAIDGVWDKIENTDAVTSVFGRIGSILPLEGDYEVFYPKLSGSYSDPSWINTLAFSKITGVPPFITGVSWVDITGDQSVVGNAGFSNTANYITSSDIPAQVNTDWNAASGVAELLNKPVLSIVATTGDYNDLLNKPDFSVYYTKIQTNVLLADKADLSDLSDVLRIGDNNTQLNNAAGYVTATTAPVTSVNTKTGAVVIDKGDLNLGNVDNTSDLNKPISTATAAALADRELVANKRTSLISPNNTTYPTTQAVSDAIAAVPVNTYTSSNGITQVGNDFRPVYGTGAGTVAQGNDSRINNGQTAFGWGRGIPVSYINSASVSTYEGDMNTMPIGAYASVISGASTNKPTSVLSGLLSVEQNGGIGFQITSDRSSGYLGFRSSGTTTRGPWRELWHSGNFTPSDYIATSQRGAFNGVATLDGSGKVPTSQLPTTGMQYQGTWNASTNSPTLSNGTGTEGYFYRVTTAGTQNLGSGNITFSVGDDVIHNGSVWQRAPSGTTTTNLALGTRTSTTMPITNSNGSGVTLPARTSSLAGLMTSADLATLNSALQSESDPTVGSHIKSITSGEISNWNSAYNWGRGVPIDYINSVNSGTYDGDMNTMPFGTYSATISSASTNKPTLSPSGFLSVGQTGGISFQLVADRSSGYLGFRSQESSTPGQWREIWHGGNFTPSDYLTTANFTWSNLSGKPSTFTPSAHTHSGSDITSGTVATARLSVGTGSNQVAAGNHGHTLAGDVTGSIGNTTIANSVVTFSKMQNIGTNTIMGRVAAGTGDATALTAEQVRTLINVANGATANSSDATLLNRANHTGVQAIGTVSGLQSALDGKEPAFSKNTAFNKNFGNSTGTVAEGNDSRINNGQTAFGWGRGIPVSYINSASVSTYEGDMNTMPIGTYAAIISGASTNKPIVAPSGLLSIEQVGGVGFQLISDRSSGYLGFRSSGSTTRGAWREIWHDGNFNPSNYAQLGTGSTQVRNNSQLDARYLQSGDLPTVNNGTLSLATGTGLTGSASFTANQAGSSSFTVAAATGYAIPTTTQIGDWNTAYGWGNHASAGYAVNGTAGSQVRTNTQLDARYFIQPTGTTSQYIRGDGSLATFPSIPSGTVTSVSISSPDAALNVTGSPITSSGTFILSFAGTTAQYVNGAGGLTAFPAIPPAYTLPAATATVLGGIELFSNTVQSTAANAVTTTASRTYGIQVNSAGQAVVNVPWSNTNTTYSAGNGLSLSGTTFSLTAINAGSATIGAVRYNGTTKTTGSWYGGTSDPTASTRLNFDGIIYASTFRGSGASSDIRLKDNILPITDPLGKLSQLGGYSFRWKDDVEGYSGNDYGLIAQEVEKVLPYAVGNIGKYKTIKQENQLIGLLVAGVNELTRENKMLRERVEALENGVS